MTKLDVPGVVTMRDLQTDEDAISFKTLNEEWIERSFSLEANDVKTLGDPQGVILAKGGRVFLAEYDAKTVGCVALIPMGEGVYELSKMAVSPDVRGRGIGRWMIQHLVNEARAMGAQSLFLGSSTKLKNAVHLYEAVGFRHVPPDSLPLLPYTRADVFMAMLL